MLGDTINQPVVETPPIPVVPPKPKSSILPLIFGFLLVIILAAVVGVVYYKNQLSSTPAPSPSPIASTLPTPTDPSSTPSASPKSSLKPSSSSKNTTTATATPRPTPVAVVLPSLDLRFGNPSGNFKQTIDEGNGDGRVIYREFTSIQAGQFDEVKSSWSPKVTLCFHIVANESVAGKDIKFTFSLDDKQELEDNLGTYDKLEAGRIYDWCHDSTTGIGKHTAKLQLNSDKSLKENNSNNNLARIDWENLADKIAPNFTLVGPFDWGTNGTCLLTQYVEDNVTPIANLKVEQQVDAEAWATQTGGQYCFKGSAGSSHTYAVKITDARGNINEQKKTFVLY